MNDANGPRRWQHALRGFFSRLVPLRVVLPFSFLRKGLRAELAHRHGWARTLRLGLPLDEHDRPIPWMAYVAVDFLAERLTPNMTVLEIGAGYSTLWLMERVARVVSLEHDREWCRWLRARVGAEVTLIETDVTTAESYLRPLAGIAERFDVVLVDGRHRVEAVAASLPLLADDGVLVLDDSRRPGYAGAFDEARRAGFRWLSLEGHKPARLELTRTTIFYRDGNCLGI